MKIPVYRDLTKGDKTLVGVLELDPKLLPPDPFYSIVLVHKKEGEFNHVPVASSLVDDYMLSVALYNQYSFGADKMLEFTKRKGDLA